MIIFRYFILVLLITCNLLITRKSAAGYSDYIDLLNNRNNKPRIDLSTGWTWEGMPQKINFPYLFPDSTQNVIIIQEFLIPDSLANNPLQIWFLGINGYAEIIINGNLVRSHDNFNSPFSANIPREYLYHSGKNIIKISLSRQQNKFNALPHFAKLFRQRSILAVTREIFLEWQPGCRFDSFNYSFNGKDLSYTFEIDFLQTVLKQSKRVRLQERVITLKGRVIFNRYEYLVPEKRYFQREISERDFLIWSPESPHLYFIELRIITASGKVYWHKYRIGLRSLTTSGKSIPFSRSASCVERIRERYRSRISSGSPPMPYLTRREASFSPCTLSSSTSMSPDPDMKRVPYRSNRTA